MKKNFLCVLLSLVLVWGLMVIAAPNAFATEDETTEPVGHTHCVCVRSAAKPADHVCDETITWEPYVKGMTLVNGGHYYLTGDVGETRNLTSSSNKLNITICLNGHTFRAQTPFKVQNGNTLTICDCQGGGAIRSSKADGTGYSVWAGYNKAVVNLYSGILSGQVSTGVYARPVVVEGGTFNMYGGTIKNGNSGTITTGSPNVGYGGNVLIKNYVGQSTHFGTFNLYGGTIEGGKATVNGGNFYVDGGKLNINGGTISGGSAINGGNISASGTSANLVMTGGKLENGVATGNGGNAYTYNSSRVEITGGEITGGTAGQGGNLYITHKDLVNTRRLKISNTTITNGTATDGNGGNLYTSRVGEITMTDVTMENGVATKSGSNIYAQISNKLTITGGTYSVAAGNRRYTTDDTNEDYIKLVQEHGVNVAGTRIPGNGGNICISSISDYTDGNDVTTTGSGTVTNATIVGGNAVNGGALYIGSGAVTLDGVTAKSCGGESGRVLHVAKNATVTLKDSKMINWGTKGTAIVNNGLLKLEGTLDLSKEYNASEIRDNKYEATPDLLLDTIDNQDAVLDITNLTAADEPLTLNRYGGELDADGAKHTAAGLVAIGANESNASLLVGSHAAYKLVRQDSNIHLVAYAVQGKNGDSAVVGYESLADIAEGDGATWYVLNTDLAEQSLSKSIMLDLCGYDLSVDLADGVIVSVIDSANDKYDAAACGKLTVTGNGQTAPIVHTTANKGGAVKHYVTLKNADGSYSAHRYVAAVLTMSLNPKADALGYKATFSTDEVARTAMTDYGISVWVNENYKVSKAKQGAISANSTTVTLRVSNILAAGGGETAIYGDAFIAFNVDGQEVIATTSVKNTSMKSFVEIMETEMESGTATYTAAQITAVQNLLSKYLSKVSGWNIDAIMAWTEPAEPEATEAV